MKPLIHTYYTYIYPVLVYSIPYGNAYFVTTLQVLNTYLVKNLSLPVQAGNSLGHSNKSRPNVEDAACKGQLISKGHFDVFNSSKKRT